MRPISSSLLPLLIPLLLLLLDCPRLSAGWRRSNSARKRLKQKEAALNITIESSGEDEEREGKLFSLFNVVQFKNSPCASTITASVGSNSAKRNGTCFTLSECASKGGAARGGCAAGFGVCCVFLVSVGGGTVSQNCSYVLSPGFPSALASGTSALSYSLQKCRGDVCSFRLDFETFSIRGTADTLENNGGVCTDTMAVSAPGTNQNIPVICGLNTGQHIYVEVGNQPGDSASLDFAFSGSSRTRMFDIKVTQIPCAASYRPPEGCLQYHTGLTGRLTTFNFDATGETHLQNQVYSACVRQEEGFCCVQYSPCADAGASAFSLDVAGIAGMAAQDTSCSVDFIGIAASSSTCNQAQSSASGVRNRYCGLALSTQQLATASIPICDCTAPFAVDVFTDAQNDNVGATNSAQSRGVCLTWMQVPCT